MHIQDEPVPIELKCSLFPEQLNSTSKTGLINIKHIAELVEFISTFYNM